MNQRLFIESANKADGIIHVIDLCPSNPSSTSQTPCVKPGYKLKELFSNIRLFEGTETPTKLVRSRVLGSSNGLILLYAKFEWVHPEYPLHREEYNHLILWNPITKEHHVLPECERPDFYFLNPWNLHCNVARCGFGYDALNKTYRMVAGMHRDTQFYDLSTNKWKKAETIDVDWNDFEYVRGFHTEKVGVRFGQDLNSAVHWIMSTTNIISIDLLTEVMSYLKLPNCHPRSDHQHLGVLNGCLSFSYYGSERKEVSVWVMKEYGKEESWTYISNVMLEIDETPHPNYAITKPLLFVSSEDDEEVLLFLVEGKLAYAKAQKFTFVEGLKFHSSFPGVLNFNTLVSPKPELYRLGNDQNNKASQK